MMYKLIDITVVSQGPLIHFAFKIHIQWPNENIESKRPPWWSWWYNQIDDARQHISKKSFYLS